MESKRVLVVGGGGREHALAEALARSADVDRVFCAPGNAGTASIATNASIAVDDFDGLTRFAREEAIDLTVVGPEGPLCAGIVDRFEAEGLRAFGPGATAARIEGDKAFAKSLMTEGRIPTARWRSFERFRDAKAYIATRDTPQVVKACGLAAGKGVVVCDDPADALIAAEQMMVERRFGGAGRRIVVEEKLTGRELSVLAIVSGSSIRMLDPCVDYKRIGAGGTGANTGGMGAYCPAADVDPNLPARIESEIVVPMVDTMRRHRLDFRGVLYCGIMVTAAGPKVLEFNCRFGDPETQVLLPRLKTDWFALLDSVLEDRLDDVPVEGSHAAAVCVVLASEGYPEKPVVGREVTGLEALASGEGESLRVYHAGTKQEFGRIVTTGGRVLGLTGLGDSVADARARAYDGVARIRFDGVQYRDDIASDIAGDG